MNKIYQSINTPIIFENDYDVRINGADRGVINAWMVGRDLARRDLGLVDRVRAGELPPLVFKGGVEKKVKGSKVGSLWYLAEWQGLRGDGLDIDVDDDIEMVCARTGVKVLFTLDFDKLAGAS